MGTSKLKDIVARSITLKDSEGKTRLYLGVNGDPAHSTICVYGERQRSIQISANHEGGLHIALHDDGTGKLAAGLSITSDDRVALFLYDHRTGARTEIGTDVVDGSNHITLHHQGKVRWTTRKKSPRVKS